MKIITDRTQTSVKPPLYTITLDCGHVVQRIDKRTANQSRMICRECRWGGGKK